MSTGCQLAIETSGDRGGVCLQGPDGSLVEVELPEARRFGSALAPVVHRLFSDAGVTARDLELIVVGTGPGSYTGMRVGAALAGGLARGTEARLVGVPSLDAWVEALGDRPPGLVVPAVDARRSRIYWAAYRFSSSGWVRCRPFALTRVERLRDLLPEPFASFGSAWKRLAQGLREAGGTLVQAPSSPPARSLLRLALRGQGSPPRPLYLKPTEAEERWGKVLIDPERGEAEAWEANPG